MYLSILSFNTNGMRAPQKRHNVFNFCKASTCDIMLLQETHWTPSDQWSRDWPQSFWSSGSNTSSGCAILIGNPEVGVLSFKSSPSGNFVFLKVRLKDESDLNIICLYAPTVPRQRQKFLANLLLPLIEFCGQDPVIMGGDLNFVENPTQDRMGGDTSLPQFIKGKEEFSEICDLFELTDPFVPTGNPNCDYTWASSDLSVRSRLDRFYFGGPNLVFSSLTTHQLGPLSDHAPIELRLTLHPKHQRGRGYWKLNTALLDELSFQTLVSERLEHELQFVPWNMEVWWDNLKTLLKSDAISASKRRVRRLEQRASYLRNKLNKLYSSESDDIHSRLEKTRIVEELVCLGQERGRGAQVRSGQPLSEILEPPSTYFYAAEKKRTQEKILNSISIDGTVTKDGESVRQHIVKFYSKLYSSEPTNRDTADFFLDQLNSRLPNRGSDTLCDPITEDEVRKVILKLPMGKAPGLDGLPYEFYKRFREGFVPILAKLFNHLLDMGYLTHSQQLAVISLIPKKGDLNLISNWRPISLQCCDAKILSKILANRLRMYMPNLTSESQVCSVPGRQIQDHTLLVREAIAYSNHKKAPLYIISIDQEKAFDRVQWDFMFEVLLRLGVPARFVGYVKTLYTNPTACINVNGNLTTSFPLERGVKQGCPLSMLLYALVAETIGKAIDNDTNIVGIAIPGTTPVKKVQFADDTNGLLANTLSIYHLIALFQKYEEGTGAKIAIHKTRGIALNHPEGRPLCPDIEIKWNKRDTKILGVVFVPDLDESRNLNWERLCTTIEAKTKSLSQRRLSYKGKATLINSIILSKAWHVGRVFTPPKKWLSRIEKAVFHHFWKGSTETVARQTLKRPLNKGGINILPIFQQCVALQIKDLWRIKLEEKPPWIFFEIYWLIDRLRTLFPELLNLATNTPKHVIGPKPRHHSDILLSLGLAQGELSNSQVVSTGKIRMSLAKISEEPDGLTKAKRNLRDEIAQTLNWKALNLSSHNGAFPAKHGDVRFLLSHDALLTRARLARWYKWTSSQSHCPRCTSPETSVHVFTCRKLKPLYNLAFKTLQPILKTGITLTELLFGELKQPLAQSLITELFHQIWRARCEIVFEQKHTSLEVIFFRALYHVELALKAMPNTQPYICEIYNGARISVDY